MLLKQLLLLLATLEADHWTPMSDNLICWLACAQSALLPLCMYTADRPFRMALRMAFRRRSSSFGSFGGNFRFAKFTGIATLRGTRDRPSTHDNDNHHQHHYHHGNLPSSIAASGRPNAHHFSSPLYTTYPPSVLNDHNEHHHPLSNAHHPSGGVPNGRPNGAKALSGASSNYLLFAGSSSGLNHNHPHHRSSSSSLVALNANGTKNALPNGAANMMSSNPFNLFSNPNCPANRSKLARHNSTQPLYAPLPRHLRAGERCSYAAGERCSYAAPNELLPVKCGLHRQSTFSFLSAQFPGYSTLSEQERKNRRRSWLEPITAQDETVAIDPHCSISSSICKSNAVTTGTVGNPMIGQCIPFEQRLQSSGHPITRCNPVYLTNEHFVPNKKSTVNIISGNDLLHTAGNHVSIGAKMAADIHHQPSSSEFGCSLDSLDQNQSLDCPLIRTKNPHRKEDLPQLWTLSLKPVEGASRFYGGDSEDSISPEPKKVCALNNAQQNVIAVVAPADEEAGPLPSLVVENLLRNHTSNILELSILKDDDEMLNENESVDVESRHLSEHCLSPRSRRRDCEDRNCSNDGIRTIDGDLEGDQDDDDDDDCHGLIRKRRSFASFGRADCDESICDLAFTTNANDDFEFVAGQSDRSTDDDSDCDADESASRSPTLSNQPVDHIERSKKMVATRSSSGDSIGDGLSINRRVSSGFGSGGSNGELTSSSMTIERIDRWIERKTPNPVRPESAADSDQLDSLRCSSQERLLSPTKKVVNPVHNLNTANSNQLPRSATLLLSFINESSDGLSKLTPISSGTSTNKNVANVGSSGGRFESRSKVGKLSDKFAKLNRSNNEKSQIRPNESNLTGQTFSRSKDSKMTNLNPSARIDSNTITKGSTRVGWPVGVGNSFHANQLQTTISPAEPTSARPLMYQKRSDKNGHNKYINRSAAMPPIRSHSNRLAGTSANRSDHTSPWLLLPAQTSSSKLHASPLNWPNRSTAIGQLQPLRGLSGRCSSSSDLFLIGRSLASQNAKSLPDLTDQTVVSSHKSALFPFNFT